MGAAPPVSETEKGQGISVTRTSFNTGWTVGPRVGAFGTPRGAAGAPRAVTLPHDAMLGLDRAPEHGPACGYFPGGVFEYVKTFEVPEEWRSKRVTFQFEGVYRDAMVYINRDFAAHRPYGYSTFSVPADAFLRYGASNTIRVVARAHQDSRWYTGIGIHRDTWIIVAELVHLALDGVQITTPDVDAERAVVAVATTVQNDGLATRTVSVATAIRDADGGAVAADSSPVTLLPGERAVVRQRLYVSAPARWSVDAPNLYTAETVVRTPARVLDRERTRFGIRTLQLDPKHGLRINGETVKLRGACIHHDNGILGAAAIARAEERRVQRLKQAGFNAIRSAHNPLSRAMLDACDAHGMLVMDETFDVWTEAKTAFDYALAFPEWWERDVEAMVRKDFNHPSVVLYSIGNEIFETGRPLGAAWGRKLAEKVRSLDDTRYITNGINGMLSVLPEILDMIKQQGGDESAQDFNAMLQSSDRSNRISATPLVTEKTAESQAVLDVAGINYGDARYVMDRELFPNRIIVGAETFPAHIDVNWKLVRENSHVIGDFTWTGWDYLGEAGIGRVDYVDEEYTRVGASSGPYPWLVGGCGDIDITGYRRPASYYREIVFGLRHEPYIAVQRPEYYGRKTAAGNWSWTDSVSSWSWGVPAGSPVRVEVYSDADEVELLVNGRSLGRAAAGESRRFRAEFDTVYEPGELVAIGYTAGREQGRTQLRSATGPVRLGVRADRGEIRADDADLAFVDITLEDRDGTVATHLDRLVTVHVRGAGTLQGLGSGRGRTEERFDAPAHTTFDGRALAIIRPTGEGAIEVTVSAEGCEDVTTTIDARAVTAEGDEAQRASAAVG